MKRRADLIPPLQPGEVHVWQAVLPAPDMLPQLTALLDAAELTRARRFLRLNDTQRYITARGQLRLLLGHYLQRDPASIRFAYAAQGKPLAVDAGGLAFNISHTDKLALYAFAYDTEIGVDVETVKPDFPVADISGYYFSMAERAALSQVPLAQRPAAFFNGWTRKEAYIKAVGDGLSLPLDSFDVTLTPGEPARLLATRAQPTAASEWSLFDLQPGPGYAGALAVYGSGWRVVCLTYPPDQGR